MIKKMIAIIIIALSLLTSASADRYILFGNVVDLEWDSDCVTADDGLGNLWEFYGCDDFFVADLIVMIIDDNGTAEYVYDDCVLDAWMVTPDEAQNIIKTVPENFFPKFAENF